MKVNVKRARQQQSLNTINQQESDAITFCLALGCEFCRTMRNFGKKRLNNLIQGMYFELADHFMIYREDEDDVEFKRDDVPFLYTGLRNQVTALDVNVEDIEREFEFDRDFGGWMNSARNKKRLARFQLLNDRERMFRSFWYAMMLYLWRTYGWGKDRLSRFYRYVRQQYYLLFRLYLICEPVEDENIIKTAQKRTDAIKKIGVVL